VGSLEPRASDQANAAWRDLLARVVRTPLASKLESPPSGLGAVGLVALSAACRLSDLLAEMVLLPTRFFFASAISILLSKEAEDTDA